jgi:hypothetical protein
VQTVEIFFLSSDKKIDVFAKLGCAVKHAGLAAHKQRLNLMSLYRRKNLSDRVGIKAASYAMRYDFLT